MLSSLNRFTLALFAALLFLAPPALAQGGDEEEGDAGREGERAASEQKGREPGEGRGRRGAAVDLAEDVAADGVEECRVELRRLVEGQQLAAGGEVGGDAAASVARPQVCGE